MKSFKSFSKQYDLQEQLLKRAAIAAALSGSAMAHAEHTVKKGDTLSALAQKHNTTAEELAKLNQIQDPNLIKVGQVIKFPDKKKTPETKPATPQPAAPQVATQQTQKNCYGELCSALQQAETGSFENKFIRTTHRPKGGSTAWGPGQITGSTIRDMFARHPGNFPDKDYVKGMIGQSEKFALYGNEPKRKGYHQRWDYGGSGNTQLHDEAKYNQAMEGVLRGMAKDLFGKTPDTLSDEQRERLVTRYRGASRTQDPRYFGVIDKAYNK